MKVIFLDIDGVLNSFKYDLHRGEGEGNIDITRMPLLKRIVDKTGALIVLSSSWRKYWEKEDNFDPIGAELDAVFGQFGLEIYDKTPFLQIGSRAHEIMSWLEQHESEVDAFVVIDDAFGGWGAITSNVVRTDARIGFGLMGTHVDKAIEILNRAR